MKNCLFAACRTRTARDASKRMAICSTGSALTASLRRANGVMNLTARSWELLRLIEVPSADIDFVRNFHFAANGIATRRRADLAAGTPRTSTSEECMNAIISVELRRLEKETLRSKEPVR